MGRETRLPRLHRGGLRRNDGGEPAGPLSPFLTISRGQLEKRLYVRRDCPAEEEATGKVKEIYEEIKARLAIDFVPNLYRAMAAKPDFLEASWKKSQTVMRPGKLV